MDYIKVLIIDKNILVRRAIITILQNKERFQVFWIDEDHDDLLTVVKQHAPDIVLLNIETIEGNGLDLLQRLQGMQKDLPVIVISPRNKKGAQAAITALRLGAVDFITKPEHKNLILFAERHLEKRLPPLLKAIAKIKEQDTLDEKMLESLARPQKTFEDFHSSNISQHSLELVVIGGCTGGVQSLFTILGRLPADLGVPILIVQHLPRTFTSYLAESLDSLCNVTICEAQPGQNLEPGTVYLAPGGYQCEVSQTGSQPVIDIHRGPRENNMRPSIDVLFRSAAKSYRQKVLGILLSGCGYDGISGAQEIQKHFGKIIVQDPRTAIAAELPFSALSKGITKEYYTSSDIAAYITQYAKMGERESVSERPKDTINTSFMF